MINKKLVYQNLFNFSLIFFTFNFINREFKLFGVIDLRILVLLISIADLFINKNTINIKSIKNSKIIHFLGLLLILNLFSTMIGFNIEYYKIVLNLLVLQAYNFFYIVYLSINRDKFSFKLLTNTMRLSVVVLLISMFIAYSQGHLYRFWASIDGIIISERTSNFLGQNFRLSGYAEDANYATLNAAIFLIVSMFCSKSKLLKILDLVICTIIIIFSASKTILLALIVVLLINILEISIRRSKQIEKRIYIVNFKKLIVYFSALSSILLVLIVSYTKIDYMTLFGTSFGNRIEMWIIAIKEFIASPLIGRGTASARILYSLNGGWLVQTHNTYIQMLSEYGVIGIYLYICALIYSLKSNNRLVSSIMILFSISSITQEFYHTQYFAFVFGLALCAKTIAINENYRIFFVNSLSGGGAEKAVSNLLENDLDGSIHNFVFTISDKVNKSMNLKSTSIFNLSLKVPLATFWNFMTINSISFLEGTIEISTAHLLKSHLIARVSNIGNETKYMFHSTSKSFSKSKIMMVLYKFIYNNKTVGFLSNDIAFEFLKSLEIIPGKVFCFKNSIDFDEIDRLSKEEIVKFKNKYILFCGRLETLKRVDFAIDLFKDRYLNENYDLIILGEGSLREKMQHYATEVSNRIHFMGFQKNPYYFMKNASAVILVSEFEAAPMIILESLYLKTPIFCYDCDFGPREMLLGTLKKFLINSRDVEVWSNAIRNHNLTSDDETDRLSVINGRDVKTILEEIKREGRA